MRVLATWWWRLSRSSDAQIQLHLVHPPHLPWALGIDLWKVADARIHNRHQQEIQPSTLSKTSINVRVRVQHKCHLANFATVTDYNAFNITRGRFIGGLSVLRYFRTVCLWMPVSLVIPLMDRPLRFAA